MVRGHESHFRFFKFKLDLAAGRGLDDVLGGVYLIVLGTVTENPEVDALSAEIGDAQIGVAQSLSLFVVEKDDLVDAEVQVHYF